MIEQVYVVLVEEFTSDWDAIVGSFLAGTYLNQEDAESTSKRLEARKDSKFLAHVIPSKLTVKARSDANS